MTQGALLEKRRKTGVLLVDAHPMMRDGLAGLLRTQSRYLVLGEADTAAEALKSLVALRPDLVLIDLRLPDADGVKVLQEVKAMRWATYSVVLSASKSDDDLIAAARAGARAYLLKSFRGEEILETINRVLAGENVLEEGLPASLRERLCHKDLTPQEGKILRLLGACKTNREICRLTRTSPGTVKTHLRSIFSKLGVSNRAQAAVIALRRGLN
jgi:DNA-binding NarL/FixJ family response regulator